VEQEDLPRLMGDDEDELSRCFEDQEDLLKAGEEELEEGMFEPYEADPEAAEKEAL
jgi:hypothetical protein